VFVRLVAKISDWFLEERINIIFCVKLGKNASDIYVLLFEACGKEYMKKSSINGSKRDHM
jgi:hypothetical protein